ncbi:nicotinate-nucleotide adenylyltransferase [Floricoccus tropicus]|uniref:Probable nicotinate-nucleotide adenylyltransferase n=2 Tax=Floricoccus tropicus TaxID=1859473 RepID=A0A1E8GMK3_9LACT|nr:nicotinate-nucleotide adenylyltransferase [Floricoccus tropicus]
MIFGNNNMVERIGILGGNFNPVHNAHLFIADQVRQKLKLDKVLLMPEANPPHVDKKKTIDAKYRLDMLELALEDYPDLGIEMIEIERGGISYSYDTMKLLKEKNSTTKYYFIIGQDMVEYLPKWYKIDELMEMVDFIAVRRSKDEILISQYPVTWVDLPFMDISSTFIRKEISEGISPNFIIPDKLISYIKENNLYSD